MPIFVLQLCYHTMPANKNALIRYKTIDACLRNPYRQWTIEDLVDACSDALYEMEGITRGVSLRTVQGDIQIMRSDKLGYNAPIEVYDNKYYRYSDRSYSIMNMPFSENEVNALRNAIDILRQLEDFNNFSGMKDIIARLEDKFAVTDLQRSPIIHVDTVTGLTGLNFINILYSYIENKKPIAITYLSFNARNPVVYQIHPYLLKEFRNRWFIFGSRISDMKLFNFALDRIVGIEVVDVPYKENYLFDRDHFFDDIIGVTKEIGAKPVLVTFWANRTQAKYIKTKPVHSSQIVLSQNKDGSCVFQIEVVINLEMYSVFLSFGCGVKILSPKTVVDYMKETLNKAADVYNTDD